MLSHLSVSIYFAARVTRLLRPATQAPAICQCYPFSARGLSFTFLSRQSAYIAPAAVRYSGYRRTLPSLAIRCNSGKREIRIASDSVAARLHVIRCSVGRSRLTDRTVLRLAPVAFRQFLLCSSGSTCVFESCPEAGTRLGDELIFCC